MGKGVYGAILFVYFETVRGLSASHSGLSLIPLMAGTVVGATLSGRSMAKVKHYKRLPIAGLLVAMATTGLLAAYGQSLSIVTVEIILAIISVGLGTVLPVTMVSTQNAVAPHQMGTATDTANFFRSLGGAFIVAIFGATAFCVDTMVTGSTVPRPTLMIARMISMVTRERDWP